MQPVTRGRFLRIAAGAAVAAALPARVARAAGTPSAAIRDMSGRVAPGYVFAAPFAGRGASGPLILDRTGMPSWFLPLEKVQAMNLSVQTYRNQPVLTWYEGPAGGALYGGSCVIYDTTYHELKRVHGGNGLAVDLHEFLITERDTALVAIANEVPTSSGRVVEGVVQELDIATGKVLFEWHSLDAVPLEESFRGDVTPDGNIDYFHLNSIDEDADGNFLVSARHTSTVYKLDRKTGSVIWRLGGKGSDFTFSPSAAFNFQHDARRQGDGTMTIFDNGATDPGAGRAEPYSRGLRLHVDTAAMHATLLQEYVPAVKRLTVAMGNVQQLPNGNVFIGWGTASGYTEFAADGTELYDATFADGSLSYRTFRFPWRGVPRAKPSVAVSRSDDGTVLANVAWNGATDVAYWELLAGSRADRLAPVALVPRSGLETSVPVPVGAKHLAVVGLDARRHALGRSATITTA